MRAILRHSVRFYEALESKAVEEDGLLVFRGHPTTVAAQELELPSPYYGRMRQILISVGAVKPIKRGSARSESEWILVHKPTEDDFDGVEPDIEKANRGIDLYKLATDAVIQQMGDDIEELRKQVQELQSEISLLHTITGVTKGEQ